MIHTPKASDSEYLAVTDTAADITDALPDDRQWYVLIASADCVVAQGSNPTADLADGSALLPAGVPMYLCGAFGDTVSIRTVTGSGHATISPALFQKS
jgi:hypothetical protein